MKDYRFLNSSNAEPPVFFKRLTDAIAKSWESLGSISCKINEISDGRFEIMFFPALREVFGGKDDGEVCYPGFQFNIGKFIRVFDETPPPKASFDSLRSQCIPHLLFKGYVEGNQLNVRILESPPNGQEAVERVYTDGPKKGTVEAIKK